MTYKVILLPKAAKQIAVAAAWYANVSPRIALDWRDELLVHIESLEQHPERCPKQRNTARKNIRYLLHGKGHGQYRIVFEVRDKSVFVLAVRHAMMNKMKTPTPARALN